MSKYDGLGAYLRSQARAEVPMSFAEIEKVTGVRLPPKAQHHRAWWSNNPNNNVMTKVWLAAGYETSQVDMEGRKLVFRRIGARPARVAGLEESHRMFQPAPQPAPAGRHPIFGALKGTFTIEPGWDLTRPALEADDRRALEEGAEKTAAMIEQGLSGRAR